MRDLILKALRESVKAYPELKGYLSDSAKQILDDGIEWHEKFEPNSTVHQYNPGKTELTEKDIDEAVKEWDRIMKEYKGMLDAKVEVEE